MEDPRWVMEVVGLLGQISSHHAVEVGGNRGHQRRVKVDSSVERVWTASRGRNRGRRKKGERNEDIWSIGSRFDGGYAQ